MSRSLVIRLLFALVATCVVAGSLYWVFLRNQDPAVNGERVELDVSRLENGPAPTHFDTGQAATISQNPKDPGANFIVRDGGLTFDPTQPGPAAAYYSSPDLGAPITGVGAKWVFTPRAGGVGAVAVVVSKGVTPEWPQLESPVPIHFVSTSVNWNISVKHNTGDPLEMVAAGNYAEPLLVDGSTAYEVRLSIDGSVVTVNLPDGSKRIVNDPRFAQWQGNFATWETYSNEGLVDSVAGFKDIWATSIKDDK
jgi:hypothetical protein